MQELPKITPFQEPRQLTKFDLKRMNIPEAYWTVTVEGVQESVRAPVLNYFRKIHEVMGDGVGLLITGYPSTDTSSENSTKTTIKKLQLGQKGVGKTSVAVLALKVARSYGYTGFFCSVWELREFIRNRAIFDEESSVFDRCRQVDLLVLDNLKFEDLNVPYFGSKELEELVRYRASRCCSTILTTSIAKSSFVKESSLGSLRNVAKSCMVNVVIQGKDLNEAKAEHNRSIVYENKL